MKIQVLTGIDGVTFDRCRSDRIDLEELTRLRDLQKKREIEREIE